MAKSSSRARASTTSRTSHLELPRDALIVITGLSGSGKSSLAFDTIYAEGQRRYVESLSAYARQFLGQMDKPDVDSIEGLSPAISIDQKTTSRNPRSTVGTVTEIYDYLRLLWARVGHPHCHNCGAPIAGQSVEQIVDHVMTLAEGTRFMVLAPVVRGRKGEYRDLLEELRARGLHARARSTASCAGSRRRSTLDKKYKHDIAVVVDRLVMKPDLRKRLADSVETAVALRGGARSTVERASTTARARSTAPISRAASPACNCGTSMPELEPRIFSFNSPHGACPRCTGLGSQMEIDPELVVPDPSLTLNEGAILPWSTSASNYYEQLTQAIADKYEIDLDTPWEDLPEERPGPASCTAPTASASTSPTATERAPALVHGDRSRASSATSSAATARPTRSASREKIEEYMSVRPCPECERRAAAAGEPGGQGRRARHPRVHAQVGARGDRRGSTSSS